MWWSKKEKPLKIKTYRIVFENRPSKEVIGDSWLWCGGYLSIFLKSGIVYAVKEDIILSIEELDDHSKDIKME